MIFTSLTIVFTILSLIGVILNIKKNHICFYIWAVTNVGWTIVDFYKGIYAQSLLFFIYFLLALWGIYEWKFKQGGEENVIK